MHEARPLTGVKVGSIRQPNEDPLERSCISTAEESCLEDDPVMGKDKGKWERFCLHA